ncbi:5-methylcytosine-specific restriction enzyme subunit McrC, partial [Candidatus Methanophagaceae archaeon]
TILLLKKINTNTFLNSKIASLLLLFPEMKNIKITDGIFKKITYNRKTEGYKNAVEISRLLLLNYHPDLSKGKNNVLALMFDMNLLWERFIYISLRKHKDTDITISSQTSKYFWQSGKGRDSKIRPDIVIKDKEGTTVLDTKWKNLGGKNPSPEDLRQIYVYHEYYNANKVALVYSGTKEFNKGNFYN